MINILKTVDHLPARKNVSNKSIKSHRFNRFSGAAQLRSSERPPSLRRIYIFVSLMVNPKIITDMGFVDAIDIPNLFHWTFITILSLTWTAQARMLNSV